MIPSDRLFWMFCSLPALPPASPGAEGWTWTTSRPPSHQVLREGGLGNLPIALLSLCRLRTCRTPRALGRTGRQGSHARDHAQRHPDVPGDLWKLRTQEATTDCPPGQAGESKPRAARKGRRRGCRRDWFPSLKEPSSDTKGTSARCGRRPPDVCHPTPPSCPDPGPSTLPPARTRVPNTPSPAQTRDPDPPLLPGPGSRTPVHESSRALMVL